MRLTDKDTGVERDSAPANRYLPPPVDTGMPPSTAPGR